MTPKEKKLNKIEDILLDFADDNQEMTRSDLQGISMVEAQKIFDLVIDNETIEALKTVVAGARRLVGEKWGHRKRLSLSEVGDKAVLIRDITTLENWIKETKKDTI